MKFSKGTVAAVFFLIASAAQLLGQFAGGTGTSLNPYQIQTPAHLNLVRNYLTAYFIQIADIDLDVSPYNAGEGWVPIGTAATPFRGNYNGNNFKIRNLFINRPATDYVGLFGNTNLATLRNIIVSNADITGASYTGAVSGKTAGAVQYANCASSGTVRGVFYTGGLTGMISNRVTVTLSYSTCDVEGGTATGGLFGQVEITSTVTNAFARGNVTGSDTVGGLIGGIAGSTVTNTFSCGAVSGSISEGGLIGRILSTSTINGSYWDVETSGQTISGGGTGKTTAQMKTQTTFSGWDFSTIWVIDEAQNYGYPYLAWSVPEMPPNPFAGGDGTELDPYQVATAEQLNKVRDYSETFFIQIADIDLGVAPWNEYEGWEPIGSEAEPFTGFYDGGNCTISGLYINRPMQNDIGLFGCCFGSFQSAITDLNVFDVNISGADNVGALIGRIGYNCQIISCSTSGEITANANAGGVAGNAQSILISKSFSSCSIKPASQYSGYSFGGIAGYVSANCSISESYSSGSVSGYESVGGLIGSCLQSSIEDCFSSADTESVNYTGGLIGMSENSYISKCYSTGTVISDDFPDKGGLIGAGYSNSVFYSYWDIDTSGLATSFGGTGKTYSEMQDELTYENWDFSTPVWEMDPLLNYGYPYLAWSTPPVNNTPFAGGNGTEEKPYLVATPTQLDSVRNHLASHFRQVTDIDLSEYLLSGNPGYNNGQFWEPIGYSVGMFEGVYDGNFNTISNLKINRLNMCIGLFSETEVGSEIRNLNIYNPDSISVTGGSTVGSLAGTNRGTFTKCSSNSNVNASMTAGGLVGYNSGTISFSYASGHISALDPEYGGFGFGGLSGANTGTISNCYSRGKVTANEYVGGLVGDNNSGTVEFCYSSGKVTGTSNTGGLTGNYPAYISYWDIDSSYQPGTYEAGGRTHTEMLDVLTYDYFWDFTTPVWIIDPFKNDGYPYLAWSDPVVPIISFAGGTGTSGDPYQVADADQLNEVRNHLDAHFIQVADIDLSPSIWSGGEGWLPIGDDSNPFTGLYNGDSYTISHLTINSSGYNWNMGLFGYVNHADLNNIKLRNVLISGEIDYAGALTGFLINSSVVTNCSATGQISASNYAGGLIGCVNSNCFISQCYADCRVDGTNWNFGGLAGQIWSSSVSDSYSRGTVSGTGVEGGFVGITSGSSFSNCYSTSFVTASGSTDIGGFAGSGLNCTVTSSYWNTESSGQTTSALGDGKTTAEMRQQATYTGWDYSNVWDMYPMNNNGYPYFLWMNLEKPPLFAAGDGSEGNPYQITNVNELQNMNVYLDARYVVMNDIDASETVSWNDGHGFEPIGNSASAYFDGYIDGKNNTITGLFINKSDTTGVGLFGAASTNSEITGIGLADINVTGTLYTGGLVGFNHAEVKKCFTTGTVNGSVYVGGLLGYNYNEIVSDCYSRCNVDGVSIIGGLIGGSESGEINYCYSTGQVTGENQYFIGGLVGHNVLSSSISSYWDVETSGVPTSYLGEGKTTAEMKIKNTFLLSGWNFNNPWDIDGVTNDGYPYFMIPVGIPQNVVYHFDAGWEFLTWDPVPEATSYYIYGSEDPYGEFSFITYNGYFHEPTKWQPFDTGYVKYFYQVIAVTGDKEQPVKPSRKIHKLFKNR
jgi:hypothetical protein